MPYFSFCVVNGSQSSQEFKVGGAVSKIRKVSPRGAPQRTDGRAGEEPEDHKRYVVRGEINEKTAHIQELWEKMGKNAKLKEKQKWSNEKSHL